jgi:hypothetical protein
MTRLAKTQIYLPINIFKEETKMKHFYNSEYAKNLLADFEDSFEDAWFTA